MGLDYALPFLPLKRPQREELETLQRVGLQVCFDAHRYAISAQTLLKAGRNTVLNNGERHTLNDPTQLVGRPDTATLVERIRRCPKTRMEVLLRRHIEVVEPPGQTSLSLPSSGPSRSMCRWTFPT